MKKVYIVLTHTGTILSRIIRIFTGDEFSHSSISLDSDLKQMYSFGRLNPYNPFIGGFVHESISYGTFKRFKYTETNIYSLNVTDEQYKKIYETIYFIKKSKEKYKFNVSGLFAISINKKIKRNNYFYCAEFVKYILEINGVQTNLPELIKPEDFKKIENIQLVYRGKLKNYKRKNTREIVKEKIIDSMRKKEMI